MKKLVLLPLYISILLLIIFGCSSVAESVEVKGTFRREQDLGKEREVMKYDMSWKEDKIIEPASNNEWEYEINGDNLSIKNTWNKANYQCKFEWIDEGKSYRLSKLNDVTCPWEDRTTFIKIKD